MSNSMMTIWPESENRIKEKIKATFMSGQLILIPAFKLQSGQKII